MVVRSDTRKLVESNQKSNKESLGDGKPYNKRPKMAPRVSSKRCIKAREDVRKDRKVYFQFDSDILWDILCRLPIEMLLRCRCVCKTWYSVIQNPDFISMHMKISSIQQPLFICHPTSCENHLLLWDTEDVKTRKMPLYENLNHYRRIIFSHNGLLCIDTSLCPIGEDSVVIFNPITKERIELPPTNNTKHVVSPRVGFCFVPERQKHIVVQAIYSLNEDRGGQSIKFYVLTSGQHLWRLLTSPPSIDGKYFLGDTIYWNNAFHWFANKVVEGPGHECILSFDTIRETFQIISFPDAHHGRCLQLLVLNGRLSLIEEHEEKMKVWEVTGDKVGEFSIACRETYDIGTNKFSLVSRLPKNEKLMASDYLGHLRSGFVVASNDMKQYKALKIDGLPSFFYASSYNPSLVSVYSMGFV